VCGIAASVRPDGAGGSLMLSDALGVGEVLAGLRRLAILWSVRPELHDFIGSIERQLNLDEGVNNHAAPPPEGAVSMLMSL